MKLRLLLPLALILSLLIAPAASAETRISADDPSAVLSEELHGLTKAIEKLNDAVDDLNEEIDELNDRNKALYEQNLALSRQMERLTGQDSQPEPSSGSVPGTAVLPPETEEDPAVPSVRLILLFLLFLAAFGALVMLLLSAKSFRQKKQAAQYAGRMPDTGRPDPHMPSPSETEDYAVTVQQSIQQSPRWNDGFTDDRPEEREPQVKPSVSKAKPAKPPAASESDVFPKSSDALSSLNHLFLRSTRNEASPEELKRYACKGCIADRNALKDVQQAASYPDGSRQAYLKYRLHTTPSPESAPFLLIDTQYLYPNFPMHSRKLRKLWSALSDEEGFHFIYHLKDVRGNDISRQNIANMQLAEIVPATVQFQNNSNSIAVIERGKLVFQ